MKMSSLHRTQLKGTFEVHLFQIRILSIFAPAFEDFGRSLGGVAQLVRAHDS